MYEERVVAMEIMLLLAAGKMEKEVGWCLQGWWWDAG